MAWRVAKSLLTLRDQVNAKFPDRDKGWDGTIGDANHKSRNSDHNPWVDGGVVTAMDITHDPKGGVDSYKLAEELRQSQDPRIKYIISNRKIASSSTSAWRWRKYSGSNPHDHHVHISVQSSRRLYDDTAPWEIPMLGKVPSERAESEEVGDEAPSYGMMDRVQSVVGVADSAATITEKVKPLVKSKISWGAAGLGASSVATVASAAPPSLWDQFLGIWKSPFWWLVLINVALMIYILYNYWRDHGYGALHQGYEDVR